MSTQPISKPIDYDGLMRANLARVFSERDAGKRLKAIRELYTEDAVLNELHASAKGHASINEAASLLLTSLLPDLSSAQSDRPSVITTSDA